MSIEMPVQERPMLAPMNEVQANPAAKYPKVSVIIPALNEEENLPHVLPRVPEWVHEVILVDGSSKDRTVAVARELLPKIRIVQQKGKGKGAALRCGFEAATGDVLVMLDADGSTDPTEIPVFLDALMQGADFVKGSRFLNGGGTSDMTRLRRLGNQGFVFLVELLFGAKYSDLCYGYNAFWVHVLPAISLDTDGFEIETKMNVQVVRGGFKVVEVPSFEAPRVFGEGRLRTFPDGWRVLKTIFREAYDDRLRSRFRRQDAIRPARAFRGDLRVYRESVD